MHLLRLPPLSWLAIVVGLSACSDRLPQRLEIGLGDLQPTIEGTPEGWLRVEQTLTPESWFPSLWPGVSAARLLLPGMVSPPGGANEHQLFFEGQELSGVFMSTGAFDLASIPDRSFLVVGDELLLVDRSGVLRAGTLEYYGWFERGPRTALPGVACEGFLVLSGESTSLDLPDVAGSGATLLFSTCLYGSERGAKPSKLTVSLNGETVFSESQPCRMAASPIPRRIELPEYAGGRLRFEVTGGDGLALFANPTLISTGEIEQQQPDLVVFMADTFRADNLALWGGSPDLAPNMNAFVAQSLAFTRAHAPAPWTLPSQASLLTSLYPMQHGAVRSDLRLPRTLKTLPAQLRAAGYRTVAVTDGGFVSARFGLDSGFDTFLEGSPGRNFETSTMARVRDVLAMDDGRPLFLYVQTYRAHAPYFASEASQAKHPELFGANDDPDQGSFTAIDASIGRSVRNFLAGDPEAEAEARAAAARFERLYRGGVADLDVGFGQLLELLGRELGSDYYLVLTSDHGESFFEHQALAHGSSVNEEETHVPLVFGGPGLGPRVSRSPASLIDLAPTLTQLAGLAPAPTWQGGSLLDPDSAAGVTASFQSEKDGPQGVALYALVEGQRKVIGHHHDGRIVDGVVHAFDLEADPGEFDDLAAGGAEWPQLLLERHRAQLEKMTIPEAQAEATELSESERAQLRAMGYLGD